MLQGFLFDFYAVAFFMVRGLIEFENIAHRANREKEKAPFLCAK